MRRQLELNEVLRVGKRGSDLREHAGFALPVVASAVFPRDEVNTKQMLTPCLDLPVQDWVQNKYPSLVNYPASGIQFPQQKMDRDTEYLKKQKFIKNEAAYR